MARLYKLNNNKQQIDKYVLNHLRMTQQKKSKQAFIYAIGHREFSVRKLKSLLINQFVNAHSCCVQTIAIFLVAFCYLDHVAIGILMQSIRIRMIDFKRALLLLLVLFAQNSDLNISSCKRRAFRWKTNSADWLIFICSPNMFHSIYMQTFSLAH